MELNPDGYAEFGDIANLTSYNVLLNGILFWLCPDLASVASPSGPAAAAAGDDENASCVEPLLIPDTAFAYPLHGIVSPPIILFTVVTNSFICIVLLKKSMRNPTNTLLVAMAISDMLTGVWPLPCYTYFYTMGHYVDWVPFRWCFVYYCLANYIPTVFHTASIWLTVALAVHRYVCVCHSLVAKKWCTTSNVVKVIIGLYLAAFCSQVSRFVENDFIAVLLRSRLDERTIVVGCLEDHADFVKGNTNVYFNVYYWFRVIFIHLVPCSLLIVLNALLIQTMRTAQARRKQLLKQNRKSECRRLAESSVTTMMLVAVVGVFLLVELPMALLFIVMSVDNTLELDVIDDEANFVAPLWINFFILLSYPMNFFIYCGMSRQFRDTFKKLISVRRGVGVAGERPAADVEMETVVEAAADDHGGRGQGKQKLCEQTNCLILVDDDVSSSGKALGSRL